MEIGALLTELIAALAVLKYTGSDSLKKSFTTIATLTSLTLALLPMLGAVKTLSDIPWENLQHSLLGLAELMTIMGVTIFALTAISNNSEYSMMEIAVTLMAFASALKVIVPIMETISQLKLTDLAMGLGGLAAIFFTLAGLSLIFAESSGAMLKGAASFSASVVMISFSIGTLAMSLTLFAGAVTAIAGATSVVGTVLPSAANGIIVGLAYLLDGIVTLAPKIEKALIALIQSIVDAMVDSIDPVADAIFDVLNEAAISLNEHIPELVNSIGTLLINVFDSLTPIMPDLVTSLFNFLKSTFDAVLKQFEGMSSSGIFTAIGLVSAMTGLMFALQYVSHLALGAVKGVASIAIVVAEIGVS